MPDQTRPRPSDQTVTPADVTDALLWRLAIDVATAHQPDPHGRCTSPRCAGHIGPCAAFIQARQAMRTARAPHPAPPRPQPTPAPQNTSPTAVGRAAVAYPANRGSFTGWFTSTATAASRGQTSPPHQPPPRRPGAASSAA